MDKNSLFTINNDVTHGRGYVYSLQYHIVWVTKYRKSIFIGIIEKEVKQYLIEILKSLDMTILAMEVMPPHRDFFISGCAKNSQRAIFPFNILMASDNRN